MNSFSIVMNYDSAPQFRSHDCNLTPVEDAFDFPAQTAKDAGRVWGGGNEDCFSMFNNNGSLLDGLILPESDMSSSSTSSSSYLLSKSATPAYYADQHIGASDVPIFPSPLPYWSDNFSGLNGASNTFSMIHDFAGGNLLEQHGNFFQECNNNNELISKQDNPFCLDSISSNWETKSNLTSPTEESNNVKVGRYSAEERKDRILRYLKKRNQRNFNKTIKYVCRKTLADRRVRVRGRFARNNEPCEETILSGQHQIMNNQPEGNTLLDDCDANQIKEDNDWLQLREAIDSLMFLPYISFSG